MKQAKEVEKNGLDRIRSYISENRLKIKTLTSQGVTKQTIQDLDVCYEETVQLAEEYRIELDVLYDYAYFLGKLHRYSKGITVAERLDKYYGLEQVSERNQAELKNLLGIFYKDTNRFKEAEECYQKALNIYRKLAKENPEADEKDIAAICNNLGILYCNNSRMKEAEEYGQEALKIYRRLAKEHPETYEGYVAGTCNNLGILYDDTNRKKEAEKYYQEALKIYCRLAKEHSEIYEECVAGICNNLGLLYSDTNRIKKAEELYQKALEIYRRLAKENPEAYEEYVAMTCNYLGNFYYKTNQRKEAEKHYQEVLELYCNTIYYQGSAGAASDRYCHYCLNPGQSSLTVLKCVWSDPDDTWENTYWYESNTGYYTGDETLITESSALAILNSWPQTVDLTLTPFCDYTPEG